MKVLVVSSSFFPKIDGSTRCVYDHARALAARGNEVYLVTRGMPRTRREETFEGIRIRRSSYAYRGGLLLNKVRLMLEQMLMIIMLQRKERFSVIHVHGFTAGLAALPCRFMFGVPVIITTHGTPFLWPRDLWWKSSSEVKLTLVFERFVLNHCDVIVAQSPGVMEYMLRIYGKDLASKFRIVHTGVDHLKFRAPAKVGGAPQVLFVGALSEIKGLSCLIDSFSEVHTRVPEARLVLVGSGPRTKYYKEKVESLRLDGSVVFCGAIRDDARLLKLYEESDVVVLSSNVGGPISCTILEGLSCGRAVISTDVPGGIPDVLGGDVGILTRPEDRAQLTAELMRLVTDPTYLKAFQVNGRRAIVERYTLDSMIDKLTDLYREVAS